jgi:hypothetical protein
MTGLETTSPPGTKQKKNATTCGAKAAPSSSCREASKKGGSGWLFAFCNKKGAAQGFSAGVASWKNPAVVN